jgi:hypothetical protein
MCLGLATVLYLVSWIPGAFLFGVVGIVVEIIGWGIYLGSRNNPPSP